MMPRTQLSVRGIRVEQGQGVHIFTFFLHGADITRIADVRRIHRDEKGLKGFQSDEVWAHVRAITEFLDNVLLLFSNAIILALSLEVGLTQAKGRKPSNISEEEEAGTLTISICPERRWSGLDLAWSVIQLVLQCIFRLIEHLLHFERDLAQGTP